MKTPRKQSKQWLESRSQRLRCKDNPTEQQVKRFEQLERQITRIEKKQAADNKA